MDCKAKGIKGEAIAKRHYEQAGYEILETNYRYKHSEIDLIVLKEGKLLIFVEVKTRSRTDYGEIETFVSEAQQERIREAAEEYIFSVDWQKNISFDIFCVDSVGSVEIFEDAF